MHKDRILSVSQRGDILHIRFKAPPLVLDYAATLDAGNELDDWMDRPRYHTVIIDFAGVEQVSSVMLGLLVTIGKQLRDAGGRLLLCGLCPDVRMLLDRTMLSPLWEIRQNEADAFAVLAGSR